MSRRGDQEWWFWFTLTLAAIVWVVLAVGLAYIMMPVPSTP